jgi:hypothetical protein
MSWLPDCPFCAGLDAPTALKRVEFAPGLSSGVLYFCEISGYWFEPTEIPGVVQFLCDLNGRIPEDLRLLVARMCHEDGLTPLAALRLIREDEQAVLAMARACEEPNPHRERRSFR